MPKFVCPGNDIDGPCGAIVKGERRLDPNSEIAVLARHENPMLAAICRRRYVFFDEYVIRDKAKSK